jgi:hypothetical protein
MEVLWDFVRVDVEQPDTKTAQAHVYGNVHILARRRPPTVPRGSWCRRYGR